MESQIKNKKVGLSLQTWMEKTGTIAVVFILLVSPLWAVKPYQPVNPDPIRELQRWRSLPELRGLGLQCMAETKDGVMWFGTAEGVWQYDGRYWTKHNPDSGLLEPVVMALCAARDGSVYAGTIWGIARFKDGHWTRVHSYAPDLHWPVYDLFEASDGAIWAGTAWGALRIGQEGITFFTTKEMGGMLKRFAPGVRYVAVPETVRPTEYVVDASAFYFYKGSIIRVVGGWRGYRHTGVGAMPYGICIQGPDASEGKVREGDHILRMNGKPVGGRAFREQKDKTLRLTLRRDGALSEVEVDRDGWDEVRTAFAVYDVYEDRDGRMWFGLFMGEVIRYSPLPDSGTGNDGQGAEDPARWRIYRTGDGLYRGQRPHILQTRDGTIWVIWDHNITGICRLDGETWTKLDPRKWGGKLGHSAILQTQDSTVWFGSFGALYTKQNDVWTVYFSGEAPFPGGARVFQFLEARDGTLWVLVQGQTAARLDRGTERWTTYQGLNFQCETSEGVQWFLAAEGGAVRFDGQVWQQHGTEEGLMDTPVVLFTTRSGTLWAAGSHEYRAATATFDGERWVLQKHPLLSWGIRDRAVFEASDGSLWFGANLTSVKGTGGGVLRFNGRSWTHYNARNWIISWSIYGVGETADGTVWAGSGILFRFNGQTWEAVSDVPELSMTYLDAIHSTREGDLWVGTRDLGLFFYDGQTWTRYDSRDGLPSNSVVSILEGKDGSIWVKTDRGLCRFDGSSWTTLPFLSQPPTGTLKQDRTGAIWMNTGHWSSRWYARAEPRPEGVELLPPQLATVRYEPDTDAPDTRIATAAREVSQPGNTLLAWEGIDSWSRPGELQYSYRLDGGAWSSYSAKTNATFSALGSGAHTFEVRARDADFNVDPSPAMLQFRVVPPVWRQLWFIGLMAVLLSGIGLQTVRVVRRGRRLRLANEDLRREIEERERLDVQLRQMRYLDRLRSALEDARSSEEIARGAGQTVMEALEATASGGVTIEHDGRTWQFGDLEPNGRLHFERDLVWASRQRGRLVVSCRVALSEAQELTLVEETAAQVSRTLESRELEMQLLQSGRLVSLGQMAASVAHELNQQLSAISTTAGDVYGRLKDGRPLSMDLLEEMMTDVLNVVNRMESTVDHLRVFSRDTSEEIGALFDVNKSIDNSLRLIEAQMRAHGIELHLELGEGLPEVEGHSQQMEQVFLNLLSNARDAVDEIVPGERAKQVRVRSFVDDGEVVVEVEDNGVGIEAEDIGRVFEPFFTTKSADRGTGLGLSITYAIVKNHEGEIVCESVEGEGTVFRVRLPVEEALEEQIT